jgi:hypothetical protein
VTVAEPGGAGWGWQSGTVAPRPADPEPPWGRVAPVEPPDQPRWPAMPADERLTIAPEGRPADRFAVVACTVLLVVAVVCATVAVVSYRNGDRWRRLAIVRGERSEQLAADLATSERDAVELEARIRRLANEKAQAEDQREVAEGTTGAVAGAVAAAAAVADAADRCAAAVEELRAAAADLAVDDATVRDLADEAVTACVAARRAGADLLDELGGLPD